MCLYGSHVVFVKKHFYIRYILHLSISTCITLVAIEMTWVLLIQLNNLHIRLIFGSNHRMVAFLQSMQINFATDYTYCILIGIEKKDGCRKQFKNNCNQFTHKKTEHILHTRTVSHNSLCFCECFLTKHLFKKNITICRSECKT